MRSWSTAALAALTSRPTAASFDAKMSSSSSDSSPPCPAARAAAADF
eukprot:CAMPEP_0202359802 /NCGR_PEP_ID=MMETSP1126-20121109/12965_1 /ASSEMBLY_ACC=CAM_ASM_000457 /TAXON_ID=3047 /ORGANISM="Dunaliella tertiolecta, Strain CCMP1320" /LENGTH=46 /DNA_ID= /DNA_START= /DNA_END= /DNA_ORIENTATION=